MPNGQPGLHFGRHEKCHVDSLLKSNSCMPIPSSNYHEGNKHNRKFHPLKHRDKRSLSKSVGGGTSGGNLPLLNEDLGHTIPAWHDSHRKPKYECASLGNLASQVQCELQELHGCLPADSTSGVLHTYVKFQQRTHAQFYFSHCSCDGTRKWRAPSTTSHLRASVPKDASEDWDANLPTPSKSLGVWSHGGHSVGSPRNPLGRSYSFNS